ncbi:hypothetical protein B5M42_011440 [Paenibacillus athensensis]|uniref:Transmembrane protein n=1 Tax=Paenibacillus athensensis TaxID=1967502 RepID=A0A4Y8PQ81_9BACL|nr:hypothetical protein [Paenibacillus athensensis]MCD1259448.1 hypothetical protein [Paenibacillus athensensis]
MKNKMTWEWLPLTAAALILSFMLLLKPIVGVADNGDFLRIMGTAGLAYPDQTEARADQYFAFMHRQFAFTDLGAGGYVSAEVALVTAVSLIGRALGSQLFDIRLLSVVYSILLLTAFAMLLRLRLLASPAARLACAAVFLLMFLDVGYTAYFNSLFGEPMSLVFLLLTLAAALRLAEQRPPRLGTLASFAAAAVCLTAAKLQNAPAGLLLAGLALRLLPLSAVPAWRRWSAAVPALLVLTAGIMYLKAPAELKTINQYQAVYYGILKDSPTPGQDLRELGLDPKLAVLQNTNYFTPDTPIPQQSAELMQSFYPHISHGKIAWFYATHPARFLDKLQVTATNAMTIRPGYLGNYEKAEGLARGQLSSSFAVWSELKRQVLPHSFGALLIFGVLYMLVLLAVRTGARSRNEAAVCDTLLCVPLIAAAAFVVPLIGDGEADMEKHLFLFNVCYDVMAAVSLIWLVHQAVNLLRRRAF